MGRGRRGRRRGSRTAPGTSRRASAAAEHERERQQRQHLALHRARPADGVRRGDQSAKPTPCGSTRRPPTTGRRSSAPAGTSWRMPARVLIGEVDVAVGHDRLRREQVMRLGARVVQPRLRGNTECRGVHGDEKDRESAASPPPMMAASSGRSCRSGGTNPQRSTPRHVLPMAFATMRLPLLPASRLGAQARAGLHRRTRRHACVTGRRLAEVVEAATRMNGRSLGSRRSKARPAGRGDAAAAGIAGALRRDGRGALQARVAGGRGRGREGRRGRRGAATTRSSPSSPAGAT